jgi:RHS repeat-associated protein
VKLFFEGVLDFEKSYSKSCAGKYRYGYQGKYAEKDEETGWNHFELREYDPVIGRWTAVDPKGQYYSPYVGMGNDPVSGTDPDGGKRVYYDANGNHLKTTHDNWFHNLFFGIDHYVPNESNGHKFVDSDYFWNVFQAGIDPTRLSKVNDISNAGLQFIASYEGYSATEYKDVAGLPTIGYGHLIVSGEKFGTLNKTEATDLLRRDASAAVSAVNKQVKVTLNQHQFDALVSFTYNVGSGGLSQSSLLKAVNKGDVHSIRKYFSLWNKATVDGVKTVVPGLTNRRTAEADMYLNGTYKSN